MRGSHSWGLLSFQRTPPAAAAEGGSVGLDTAEAAPAPVASPNDFFGQDLPAQKRGLHSAAQQLVGPAAAEWQEVPAVLPLGGVSFHDDFCIHGSSANSSGRLRRSLACHMRTNRSWLKPHLRRTAVAAGGRSLATDEVPAGGVAVCPIIFGTKAYEVQRRQEASIIFDLGDNSAAAGGSLALPPRLSRL